MITKRLFRSTLHEHADRAQRVLGIDELPPDSEVLVQLLAADPDAQVRRAAARRVTALPALVSAWHKETDPEVRSALAPALAEALAATPDEALATSVLGADSFTDDLRADVARRTQDAARRLAAMTAIRDESALVDVALNAEHAETRLLAAGRVATPDNLRKLADAAKNKDHGVARHARQRIDAMTDRASQEAKADAILAELEALAARPGPILSAVVDLNRRWQALDLREDAARLARCDAARTALQTRFDREQEEQRTRARFERRLREWLAALVSPADATLFPAMKQELGELREEAQRHADDKGLADLAAAEQRIAVWEDEHRAVAGAEALVLEAEQLAATTTIDNAKLPERWQALDRGIRTPALTRRFEAALTIIEQRRLEQIRAAQQEASVARARVHALLHTAEQALVAGQLQAARAAVDELKAIKSAAGVLPKPTLQRQGRVVQQLTELERWESFGQHNARVQLCERAEALAAGVTDPVKLSAEVRKLREDWKTLDAQHAGVPKTLWERFDGACTKAYAPAARHFSQQAAQRKEAIGKRDEFIAAAGAHAAALLSAEPRDWRAIERWLRETGVAWREGDLGSVDPGTWKKLDAKLKAATGPLSDALTAARRDAKSAREALIAEATALAAKAADRDAPSQVKAIQGRWQEQAKALPLPQREERVLWEQFRAACDAVFEARHSKRKEEDHKKHENRRALDDVCQALEQLSQATDKDDAEIRRASRELQEQWKKQAGRPDTVPAGLDARFRSAKGAVETLLSARARSREAAVWQTLAAKERLCEEQDAALRNGASSDPAATQERWDALPALPPAWEKNVAVRRDAARAAAADASAVRDYVSRMEREAASRSELLLQLEMLLGLDSPTELSAQRLALQVKQLRDRYKGEATVGADAAGERLVAWCAQPGVAEPRDRQRAERVFSAMGRAR